MHTYRPLRKSPPASADVPGDVTTARQGIGFGSVSGASTNASARSSTTVPVLPPEVAEAAGDAARHLAQYILVRELGQGGSGTVYAAWDRKLGRWAAVKVLTQINEESAARFLREAQMASRLSHPNIVPIYEASEAANGRPFLAMKLIAGRQLSKVQLDIRAACTLMRDVADAVQYAHDNGVIHRDLKPQNLMLDDAGHVWILDFGLARSVQDGSTVTVAGAIMGTPAFMPPEQARGGHCDERSDVYSLGATLYALLSGQPPFEGDNALWVMTQVCADDPPALHSRNDRVPRDVETIVHKAMRRDPGQRYARPRALADDLRRYERGEAVTARPLGPLAQFAKRIRRNMVTSVVVTAVVLGTGMFGLGALRYAADMRVREQATFAARALAEDRLKESQRNLITAEHNHAQSVVEEGNALGAADQWQAAGSRYAAADTMFKGLGIEDPGPNAGLTDVLMNVPPPVWSEPRFHAERITELLLGVDEREAYSCSLDGTVKIFDPRTGQLKHSFDVGAQVWSLALDPSGTRLAAGTDDGRVVLLNLRTRTRITAFRAMETRVRSVAFSLDGKRVTGGYFAGTVATWDVARGTTVAKWQESPDAKIRSVGYLDHHDTIAVGLNYAKTGPWATLREGRSGRLIEALTEDGIISGINNLVVDQATGKLFAAFGGGFLSKEMASRAKVVRHLGASATVSINMAENLLVLADSNGAMQIRQIDDPSALLFSAKDAGQIGRAGRGGRVLSADNAGGIKLWSFGPQPNMGRVVNQVGAIGVQMVMGGEVVIVEHQDGVFAAFDRGSGKPLWTVKLPLSKGSYSTPSPGGNFLATADQEGGIRIFDLPGGNIRVAIKNEKPARFLSFSHDEQWLAAGLDRNSRLWKVKSGELVADLKGSAAHRMAVWMPDNRHVVMVQNDDLVAFDTTNRKVTKSFPYHPGRAVTDGFYDAKNKTLVVAFQKQGIVSYDWLSGVQHEALLSDDIVGQVAFAAGNTVLWSSESSEDSEIAISVWDFINKRRVHVFYSGPTTVMEPNLPKGIPLAASVNHAGDVVIWDLTLPQRFVKAADDFEMARKRSEGSKPARTRLALARYYALRGLSDWAAEELDGFEAEGGALRSEVGALEYGRALWRAGRLPQALSQYRRALANREAAPSYLDLCIKAIQRDVQGPKN